MYYPPYPPYQPNPYNNPNNNPSQYSMMLGEKRDLKRTVNRLCWTLLIAILMMEGFSVVCMFFLGAIGYQLVNPTSDFHGFMPILYYLMVNVSYVVGLAIPALVYFAIRRIPLGSALPFGPVRLPKAAACIFFGSAVCMLANIPANMVISAEKFFGFSGDMPEMPLTDDLWVLILYGITVIIVPPIVEELLFRGMILQSLRKYGDGFAVVVSSILFGLYHANFVQIVFAFIAGLIMALVVIRTGSLWVSILIHFINNSISLALEMIQLYGGDQAESLANYIVLGVLMLSGVISLIYLIVKDKSFFRWNPRNPVYPMTSKIWSAFTNPGAIVIVLYSLVYSINVLMNP
jgi:membrane protease YdiL (CAAX protease family)